MKKWCAVMGVLAGVCAVQAMPIEVGSGSNSAGIYIEWKDGFSVDFMVRFAEESISGLALIQRLAEETPLTLVVQDYGFGEYVDGIAWDGHSNEGWGGGEDWWHYWTRDAGQVWESPMFGASDRIVVDGAYDGWVYGSAAIPEPATLVLIGTGAFFLRRRLGN
ncbi:MAG: PEP-CTERM sorting domain-containing protein [Phycisphaerae bacterium]|nr:PEP-CTERM sorting domain-containing protein [Phycisphaerae bacterium]